MATIYKDSSEERKNLILKWLVITALVGTMIYVLLLGLTYTDIKTGKNCGYEDYGGFDRNNLINTTYEIKNESIYVLQRYDIIFNNNIRFEFCYDVLVVGNSTLKINIIDEDENILSTDFIYNQENFYCSELSEVGVNLENKNYLGIKCLNCNSSDYLLLKKELAGEIVEQIVNNNSDYEIISDNQLSQKLVGILSCNRMIKFWTVSYFTLVMCLFLMAFVFVGWNEMKKFFIDDFERRME